MNKKSILSILATFLIFSVNAQGSAVRTVTKTPQNGHEIFTYQGINDKASLYYIDDEKTPFTGKFIEKGYNNELLSEGNYIKGKRNGEYLEWQTRGDHEYLTKKANYQDDKLVGEYTEWYRPNHKKTERVYDVNGKIHGKVINYDGYAVEEPSSVEYYNHGVRDGEWTYYYAGGKIKEVKNYKNDKDNGKTTQFYKNGNKKFEVDYLNDYKNGLLSEWFEDGQLKYTCEYSNKKKNGKEVYYYPNGKIQKEGAYVNNGKKGRFVFYNQDGSISEETTFQ